MGMRYGQVRAKASLRITSRIVIIIRAAGNLSRAQPCLRRSWVVVAVRAVAVMAVAVMAVAVMAVTMMAVTMMALQCLMGGVAYGSSFASPR